MRRPTDGGVIHAQIAADSAHDDIAGVQPHSDLQVHAVRMEDGFTMTLGSFLHAQGRITGSYGVILMGYGSTKYRHDAVARSLVDGAFVMMDRLHHVFDNRSEQLSRLLGIAFGQQLH